MGCIGVGPVRRPHRATTVACVGVMRIWRIRFFAWREKRTPARGPAPPTFAPGAGYIRRTMREIVLYGRPGCHLCDEARAALERIRAELPFALVERDIEADDALFKAYLERIPVIALDGEELFEYFVDEAELRRRLAYTERA